MLKGKVAKETGVYKKGLLLVYGRGPRASGNHFGSRRVLLLLTGMRFSHMWALGSSPAPPEARGRSPGELWDLPRDHFGSNFDRRGKLWDHFWGNFLESVMPWGQVGASRRSHFCENLFRGRLELISYV